MKKEKENGLNNNLKDLQNIHEIYKQLFESVPKISLDKPASKWDRAFPIGNGHLGAMIYGNVFEDVLQTNEDTLWSGFPRDQNNYDAIKHLEEVRELIFKGDYSAAKEIVEKKMLGKYMQAYMPFVNIHMRFLDSGGSPYGKKEKNLILKRVKKGWGNNNREDVEYIRELDLSRAVVSVKHRFLPVPPEDDIYIEREYFASHVDDAIFIKISLKGGSDKNKGSTSSKFNIELDLSSDLKITSKTLLFDNENRPYMVVRGQAPSYVDSYHRKIANSVRYDEADKSLRFEARLYVLSSSNKDLGKINEANKALSGSEGIIKILNTSEIILAFIGASNYGNKDPTEACDNIIRRIIKRFKENSFERIKEEHIVDYQNLFSKVELKFLPDENDAEQIIKQYSLERLSMDKRIYRLYNRRKRTLYFIRQILHLNRGGHLKKSISKAGLEFYNGSKDFDDLGLISTYFQFGRYLLISSSRKGSQPANLQGIWNDKINPPWASNYTININTEMNYWLADLTNLSECFEPLLKMVEELVDNGKKTAKIHYNCNGWCAHHNTTLWRQTHPVEGAALWAMWPFGGVWLCLNLWDHFLFNRDIELLRNRIYPLLKGSAEFVLDWLIKLPEDIKEKFLKGEIGNTKNTTKYFLVRNPDDQNRSSDNYKCKFKWVKFSTEDLQNSEFKDHDIFITCPSTSPENAYKDENGVTQNVHFATTSDMTLTRELFLAVIQACEILNIDHELKEKLENILPWLFPYQVSSWDELYAPARPRAGYMQKGRSIGRLLEWAFNFEDAEPGHRHQSHSIGLYPGSHINLDDSPELAYAIRNSLLRRIDYGGGGTGWSNAWKLSLFARLRDRPNVLNAIAEQIKLFTVENLFNLHPPFQIDGNFGAAAGIAEMLVQSHSGIIDILPALPPELKNGLVKGLKVRGNCIIDIEWQNGKLKRAIIKPNISGRYKFRYLIFEDANNEEHPINLRLQKDGKTIPPENIEEGSGVHCYKLEQCEKYELIPA